MRPVSLPSIQQVLEENGLGDPTTRGVGDAVVQGELFCPRAAAAAVGSASGRSCRAIQGASRRRQCAGDAKRKRQTAALREAEAGANRAGERTAARLLFARAASHLIGWNKVLTMRMLAGCCLRPLLARYDFLPTLSRVITIPTHEGYSLEELGLTWFYLDVFGFRSMEDFKAGFILRSLAC